jgi:hypothetical protein
MGAVSSLVAVALSTDSFEQAVAYPGRSCPAWLSGLRDGACASRSMRRSGPGTCRPLTVTAARGHRIGVDNLIISRRNDPTIGVFDATDIDKTADPVRNGNRWQVYAVDTEHHRIAARRLDDGARAAFSGDYLREHITRGYAVTVQGLVRTCADHP